MMRLRVFASLPWLALLAVTVSCWIAPWPHAPEPPHVANDEVISPTLYLPHLHHLGVDSCKTMFPPDDVGALCEYNDGIWLPDLCGDGYHMENQATAFDVATGLAASQGGPPYSWVVHRRKVCHLNSARGERGAGLDCEPLRQRLLMKGTP